MSSDELWVLKNRLLTLSHAGHWGWRARGEREVTLPCAFLTSQAKNALARTEGEDGKSHNGVGSRLGEANRTRRHDGSATFVIDHTKSLWAGRIGNFGVITQIAPESAP